METEQVERAVDWAGLGFGVLATAAPGAFLKAYAAPERDPMLAWMTRLWGTRTALLSVLALAVQQEDDRRRVMTGLVAMNVVDTAIALTRGDEVPAKTRRQAALTSAAFAAVGAWLLSRRDR